MARRLWPVLVPAIAFLFAGCAYVIASGVAAAVLATNNGKTSSLPQNIPTTVVSAVESGTTGTVWLDFTLVDPQSHPASVKLFWSENANDDPTKEFASPATGSVVTPASGATVSAPSLTTSPSGITYRFLWVTATDLQTGRSDTLRLQVVVDGVVGSTSAVFTVDNTALPLVTLAAAGPPPGGATVFADEQNAMTQPGGFVAVSVAFASAQSLPVQVGVFYSTDGGMNFPPTQVAVGQFVNASGTPALANAIQTAPGAGMNYTFRFQSATNGLGTGGQQDHVALRFTVQDTRIGAPLATAPFSVNNAPFSAVPSTPAPADITDNVALSFELIGAGESLDVAFDFSLNGASGPFAPATAVLEPPAPAGGFLGLAAVSTGSLYGFVWNSYQDMALAAAPPTFDTTNATLQVRVTRPTTLVQHGPFRTGPFAVDHRLIHTVLGRSPGLVRDGVPALQEPLVTPGDVAFLPGKLFVTDFGTERVRVIDLATGIIDTVIGGGTSTADGTPGKQYFLSSTNANTSHGLATSPLGFGVLFVVSGDPSNPKGAKILRVDLATPPTVSTFGTRPGEIFGIAYEPLTDTLFWLEEDPLSGLVLVSAPVSSPGTITVRAGGGATPVGDSGTITPTTNALLDTETLAANWTIPGLQDVVVMTMRQGGPGQRLVAVNTNPSSTRTVCGVAIPPDSVKTFVPSTDPSMAGSGTLYGISIADTGLIYFMKHAAVIYSIAPSGLITRVAGTGVSSFQITLPAPAATTPLGFPFTVTATGSAGFAFPDLALKGVLQVDSSGTMFQVAGNGRSNLGDGQPSLFGTFPFEVDSVLPDGPDVFVSAFPYRLIDTATTLISSPAVSAFGDAVPVGPNFYVADKESQTIEALTAGTVVTLAGVPNVSGPTTSPGVATSSPLGTFETIAVTGKCIAVAQVESLVTAVNLGAVTTTCCGVSIPAGWQAPIAGNPSSSTPPSTGAQATAVALGHPQGIFFDHSGNLYFTDAQLEAVFEVDATTGKLTVVAGTIGVGGESGDGGPATSAKLVEPKGVCLDEPLERVVYILEHGGSNVGFLRGVNITASPVTVQGVTIAPGAIMRIAGASTNGDSGDGGPALNASIDTKGGNGATFFADAAGRVVFGTSTGLVRYVDAVGIIRTYAGLGADGDGLAADNATLTRPTALAARADGAFAVADLGRVRLVPPATTTVTRLVATGQQLSAGDGGSALAASCDYSISPVQTADVVMDGNGPRQIAFSTTGVVTSLLAIADTLAGSIRIVPIGGAAYVGTSVTVAAGAIASLGPLLSGPEGVTFTSNGLLVASDTGGNRIGAINLTAATITYGGVAIPPGAAQAIVSSGIQAPRNLAHDPVSGLLVFQQGGAVVASQVSALNPTAASVVAYGQTIPAGAVVRIDSGVLAAGDQPRGVAVDPQTGDAYFAVRDGLASSTARNAVFRISHASGATVRVAGSGTGAGGLAGDEGIATNALLDGPFAVGVDGQGALCILDGRNLRVRRCRQP